MGCLTHFVRFGRISIFPTKLVAGVIVVCLVVGRDSSAQQAVLTSRSDNQRTGASVNETFLTPAKVNKNTFGRLFTYSLDYQVLAQPLYVPNVQIPGQGTHNVVYVATMADSVYAFDADSQQGGNSAPLWHVNFTDPTHFITTANLATATLPCAVSETKGPGFTQEGIVSTPVVDLVTGTLYVVAKTLENGTVEHHLHALDITNGQEKFGGPVLISASSKSNQGHVTTFNSLHQKNRPGLLLQNGVIYIGFGSNFCNDSNSGWVLSYNAANLSRMGVFNTSPDHGLVSIWQAGNGLAADQSGNVYAETAESGVPYDVPSGGQTYANSILKFGPDLTLADYFTPWSVAFLNSHDLDLSSSGPLLLPDQNGPYTHELIASGKQGWVYVLNRDNMGMYSSNDTQVVQEVSLLTGETTSTTQDQLFGSPAYWNNTVYFTPLASPVLAFPLSGGLLGIPLKTSAIYSGSHSPSISANGLTYGILWVLSGSQLLAFDAVSLKLLYSTNQAANGRDKLPAVSHFVTQTVANGKVYVATRTTLEVYGLFSNATVTSGANQTAPVLTTLPAPLTVGLSDAYSGAPLPGLTVNFSDGGKGGSLSPTSSVTDNNGVASTVYTLPKTSGTYTVTMSTGMESATAVETAVPTAAVKIISYGGANQTGAPGSVLPKPIVAQVRDFYNNGVPGVTVNFTTADGAVSPSPAVTDSKGLARTNYQLPNATGTFSVSASSTGLKSITFPEMAVAGP